MQDDFVEVRSNIRCVVTIPTGYLAPQSSRFYCQDSSAGIAVVAPPGVSAALGDSLSIAGTAMLGDNAEPEMEAASLEKLADQGPPAPVNLTASQARSGLQAGRLVRIVAPVAALTVQPGLDLVMLAAGTSQTLRVFARHASSLPSTIPPQLRPGDVVRVTGVLIPQPEGEWCLRYRSAADVELIELEPWHRRNFAWLAGAVLTLIALFLSWALVLRRIVRQRTRQMRVLLREARQSSRLKSEFLAMMSHEIRTPLHGVLGLQRLVLDSTLSAEQREQLEMSQQAANSLLALLNDILDFSKIEADRLDLAVAPFPTANLVKHLAALFSAPAREKGLQLDLQLDPSVPPVLEADQARIQQILVNLVGNACKFTARGSISVSLSCRNSPGGSFELCASVRDTGCGIPLHAQKYIFEPFRQADAFTARRHGGSGLGLSISAKLARLVGGELWLHQSTAQGSEFRLRILCSLPSSGSPAPSLEDSSGSRSPSAGLRVLVAEDNSVNQHVISRLLERSGHTPVIVANGRLAIEALSSARFDAILMDVQMPEMDGVQATAAIRALEANSGLPRIPIIGLTAHTLKGDRERFLKAGMDECLTKPLEPAALFDALERFCSSPAKG